MSLAHLPAAGAAVSQGRRPCVQARGADPPCDGPPPACQDRAEEQPGQPASGSVAVDGFAVLDNHLHRLVRLEPDVAAGWADEEVVRRWGRLFPPRDRARQAVPVSDAWVQERLRDVRWVVIARQRLESLSWFMMCLKEPLSRMANREENTRGAFFEGRFQSVAILDEESLLATCASIDLKPVAAGIAEVPEASAHASIKEREEHIQEQGGRRT